MRSPRGAGSATVLTLALVPGVAEMSDREPTKEQRILAVMRKVLASVVKDVTPPPGMRGPLSDRTVEDIRNCLALIAARERELWDEQGSKVGRRPYYADETPAGPNVISLQDLLKTRDE